MSKKKYIDLNDRDLVSGKYHVVLKVSRNPYYDKKNKYHKERHIAYARINRKNIKALKDVYGV